MKKLFFFFTIILCLTQISALEFYPANLEFNLTQNQQSCKKVFFSLDSQTTVSDSWAQNETSVWSITQFQTSAQQLGITLNYPANLDSAQTNAEICISGANTGNYKGAMIFRQGELGNSLVQFAVWLKVSISGEVSQEPPQDTSTDENKSKKKSKSSRSSTSIIEHVVIPLEKPKQSFQEINLNLPEERIELRRQVLKGDTEERTNLLPIFVILITLLFFSILLFLLIRRF